MDSWIQIDRYRLHITHTYIYIYIYIYMETRIYIYMNTHIYIYIYRERERDRSIHTHTHTHIYIYIYQRYNLKWTVGHKWTDVCEQSLDQFIYLTSQSSASAGSCSWTAPCSWEFMNCSWIETSFLLAKIKTPRPISNNGGALIRNNGSQLPATAYQMARPTAQFSICAHSQAAGIKRGGFERVAGDDVSGLTIYI